jgi:hypothetical protein
MSKQRHRDLGGVLARLSYDTRPMHHGSLYNNSVKSIRFKCTPSYTDIFKKLQRMVAEGRACPKLRVGKLRYQIDKKEFMPVFAKFIFYIQKWSKQPPPTWWEPSKNRNRAWVCPDDEIRATAKYLRDVYNSRKKAQSDRFDLVLSQRSWDYLRSDYNTNGEEK